nr:hypothetical protein [Paludibacteraceae bacterium]
PEGEDGSAAQLTQDGNWWVYTTPKAVTALNIIFRNGDDWGMGQTIDLKYKADVCIEITGADDELNVDGKRAAREISCE